MTETFENAEQPAYPPKPLVNEPKSNPLAAALISLALFALLGYLLGGGSWIGIAILVAVVVIHEAGHLSAMWLFGYEKLQMLFIPLAGAVAIGRKQDISEKQSAIVILAGPLPGLLIGYAIIFFCGEFLAEREMIFFEGGAVQQGGYFIDNAALELAARWFIYLNALNLLPFFPLDGGQLFRILFFRSGFTAYFIFAIISFVLLALLFWGSYILLAWLVFSFGLPLYRQFRAQAYYKALREKNVDHRKSYDELSDRDFWIMRESLPQYLDRFRTLPPNHATSVPVDAQELNAICGLLDNRVHDDLGTKGRIFFALLWLLSIGSVFVVDHITGQVGLLERMGM